MYFLGLNLSMTSQWATIVGVGLGFLTIIATLLTLNAKYDLYIRLLRSNLDSLREDNYASLGYKLTNIINFQHNFSYTFFKAFKDEVDPIHENLKTMLNDLLFKNSDDFFYGSIFHYLFEIAHEQNKFHYLSKDSRMIAIGREIQSLLCYMFNHIISIINDKNFQDAIISHRQEQNLKLKSTLPSVPIIEDPTQMIYSQISQILAQFSGAILSFTRKVNVLNLFQQDLTFPSFQYYFNNSNGLRFINRGLAWEGQDETILRAKLVDDNYIYFELVKNPW
jgi:hypothetical protein